LCAPVEASVVEALSLTREIVKNAENGISRPLGAYREGLIQIPHRFADPNLVNDVQLAVPSFQSIRASLYR